LNAAESRYGYLEALEDRLYASKAPGLLVAAFAEDVATLANEADAESRRIMNQAGRLLSGSIERAADRVFSRQSRLRVVVTGGLAVAGKPLTGSLVRSVQRAFPLAEVEFVADAPIAGSALLAQRDDTDLWFPGGVVNWTAP
jgi:N-acetylglucosamine kinase-like BadF-type ATPase